MDPIVIFLGIFGVGGCIGFAVAWVVTLVNLRRVTREFSESEASAAKRAEQNHRNIRTLEAELERVRPWTRVADADGMAKGILRQAETDAEDMKANARILLSNAEAQYHAKIDTAEAQASELLESARIRVKQMGSEVEQKLLTTIHLTRNIKKHAEDEAERIAGDAVKVMHDAQRFTKVARAMKNMVDGYGDEYLIPSEGLLEELSEEFSHKEAGQQLKMARSNTRLMIKNNLAATCDYVEDYRRSYAEKFVISAFNGYVDSILSRVKHDNAGKLEQEVRDAFTIVNEHGQAFRNAGVTPEYLEARLEELRWASVAHLLRKQQQEEQRRIREQIREEEKARRDYERAMKEARREEDVLQKAVAEAMAKAKAATEEQRAVFEQQLQELELQLAAAHEKNQRAISMAQQTKRGHIYIISNVGSFGEGVYKIGMTRRLEPLDRVKELGDASVPFGFDVHAMIYSENAPELESRLHKHFVFNRINKVNHRKEFFRSALAEIREEIDKLNIETHWTMISEAAEYRESLAIEAAIIDNPDARAAWASRQYSLEDLEAMSPDPAEDEEESALV